MLANQQLVEHTGRWSPLLEERSEPVTSTRVTAGPSCGTLWDPDCLIELQTSIHAAWAGNESAWEEL